MRTTVRLGLVGAFALGLVAISARAARPHEDPQLVTVDVRVSDKTGNPVTALDRGAFQLFVGGKPEKILSFKSITAASGQTAATAEPGKTVMIIFDVHTMDYSQATIAQRAASAYASRHMGPNDRLAVAVYGRNLQIIQPFTGDRQKVLEAVGRPLTTFGTTKLEKGFGGAEGIQLAKNVLRSLRTLAAELGPIDSRKSVLVFTQDFSAATGEEFSKLVDEARASRVSFYTLITTGSVARKQNPASRGSAGQPRPVSAWSSLGTGAGMSFSAFAQQRGGPPTTKTPTGPTGSGIADPSQRESVTGLDAVTANTDILQNLAKETYGDVVREANNLSSALDSFDLRLSNYYLLGFLLDANRLEKSQKIEVKVNAKDARLSYPRQYVPAKLNEDENGFPLPKNLSSPLEAATAPAAPATLAFRPVVLQAADDVSRVVLFADPAHLSRTGPTSLLAVALDEANRACARFESRLLPEQRQEPVHASLLLRPGAYRIRMALRDEKSWLSTGEQSVKVTAPSPGQLSAATLVISERVEALPDSVRGLSPILIAEDHPLSFKGYRVVPSVTNHAARKNPVALLLTLYNVKDVTATRQLKSEPRLVNDSGEVFLLSPVQHLETAQAIGDHTVLLGFTISLTRLKDSHYRLVLDTTDPVSKDAVSCETEVFLE